MRNSKSIFLILFLLVLIIFSFLFTRNQSKSDSTKTALTVTETKSKYSKVDAENIVKELPEVKAMLKIPNSRWVINVVDSNDNFWLVQVSQVVKEDDQSEHSATFNWYKLDMNTGKVVSAMFPYDQNGKLIE